MRRGVLIILSLAVLGTLISGPAQAVPGNDNFANATNVPVLDYATTIGAEGATTEPGELPFSCHPTGVGQTVWWKFTPGAKVHVKANTYESSYDTVLDLYHADGPNLADLEEIACNDNVAAQKTSRVTQILEAGQTYYFRIGSKTATPVTLKFRLKVRKWKVGITRGNDWFLNDLFDGTADSVFEYGAASDFKLAGNWGGHGADTPWLRRGSLWLANDWFDATFAKQFNYGASSDWALLGDWDGQDEVLSPGVRRGNVWYLNNGTDGAADIVFAYGSSTDWPLVGDWDGDGDYTPGIRRGNVWYLNNNFDSTHDIAVFAYGSSTDWPVVGDWNGDGKMTPGIVRKGVWYLSNDFDADHDIPAFGYGSATDRPIVGDWDGIVE
ncbi:MAG: hypothetical protein ACRDJ1_04540 [Actinomycetota bacterium]